MKTARHERAFHELIKGAEHGVFTTRMLKPTGLEMWLEKKEKQRGRLEINLQLSLSFHCAALGLLLSAVLTLPPPQKKKNHQVFSFILLRGK